MEEALVVSSSRGTDILVPSIRADIEECKSYQEFAPVVQLPSGNPQMDSSQIERLQEMMLRLASGAPTASFLGIRRGICAYFRGTQLPGCVLSRSVRMVCTDAGAKNCRFCDASGKRRTFSFFAGRQMVPSQQSLLRPGLLPVALFVLLCVVVASLFQVRIGSHFLHAGEACLKAGVPYAIPAALVFWLILRRGAILSPRVVGAIAGMLASRYIARI